VFEHDVGARRTLRGKGWTAGKRKKGGFINQCHSRKRRERGRKDTSSLWEKDRRGRGKRGVVGKATNKLTRSWCGDGLPDCCV